jgi:hypothetical protein
MKKAMACRKRPCRICRRWFSPNPRLKDRQMTCGEESCKREWHRRKCAQWNKDNSELLKKDRLAQKLKAAACAPVQKKLTDETRPRSASVPSEHLLPWIQEVITAQLIVMLDYLVRHFVKGAQEVIGKQPAVNTG